MYLVFIYKKTNLFIPIVILIILLIFRINTYNVVKLPSGNYTGEYIVEDINEDNLILKSDSKILIYNDNYDLKPGDIIKCSIRVRQLENASYTGDFDAEEYYNSKGIGNRGSIISYEVIGNRTTVNSIKYDILNYYDKNLGDRSFNYLKALIFGTNDFDTDLKNAYSILYISHILAISGMHLVFFNKILILLFNRIFRIEGRLLSTIILGIYLLLIGFPTSALRAYLFIVLELLNLKGYVKYTRLDILSLAFIIMGFINPLMVYQNSFILSFIISFILIFMDEFIKDENKIKKMFKSTLICILCTLPFVINMNNNISIIGMFLSTVFSLILGKYLLPFILIILIFPLRLYEIIFLGLDNILILVADNLPIINCPSLNAISIIGYYVLFVVFLVGLIKEKRIYLRLMGLIVYLLLIFNINIINPNYRITYIDVGQGDSILIELPFNKGNILIDSYNNIDYLKSINIKKLDYIILSHFDNDHMESVEDVCSDIIVDNIVYPRYSDNSKLANIGVFKMPVSSGDVIETVGIRLEFLGPINKYDDENSNSLVLKININGYVFLFTGDMTVVEENDLIEEYGDYLKCDVLKVAHHGSNTSSSENFLRYVKPKYSIISVGLDNYYNHPNEEVIKRLSIYSNVLMTKNSGNIKVIINDNMIIKEYR